MTKLKLLVVMFILLAVWSIKGIGVATAESAVEPILSDWTSIQELEAFLEQDDTDHYIYLIADKDGIVKFNGQCEDADMQLRNRAMQWGRFLSIEVLDTAEYQKWYGGVLPYNNSHAICSAITGNEIWFIEPSTDRHWLAWDLD